MLAALALGALLAVPGFASGQGGYDTDPTRAQWVDAADAECKQVKPKVRKLARQTSQAAKRGKPVMYGRNLVRLARVLIALKAEIRELARPPADADRIEKWLDIAVRSDKTAIRSARAIMDRKYRRGRASYRKAAKLSERSARLSRPFKFKHC